MWFFRKRGRRPEPPTLTLTHKVNLGALADKRAIITYVERPDQYSAVDYPAATAAVDRDLVLNQVHSWVAEALAARALDEYNSDFLDGRISKLCAGWDEAVNAEKPKRCTTQYQLQAMERGDVSQVQDKVGKLRAEVDRLSASVAAWRAVLQGHDSYGPLVSPTLEPVQRTAPLPVDLTAAIAAARSHVEAAVRPHLQPPPSNNLAEGNGLRAAKHLSAELDKETGQ